MHTATGIMETAKIDEEMRERVEKGRTAKREWWKRYSG